VVFWPDFHFSSSAFIKHVDYFRVARDSGRNEDGNTGREFEGLITSARSYDAVTLYAMYPEFRTI
jgi:hypothetical protein